MWVEELRIENIRCFCEESTMRFARSSDEPYRWITFLSENGGGKSTALQALGLLLAGPEGAQKLLPHPLGWLRNQDEQGRIYARIHQGEHDPGQHGDEKVRKGFSYSYAITGSQPLTINGRLYTEPSIVPAGQSILTWLRKNAFPSTGKGWFGVGYGAFRRLTRSSQIIVPALDPQARFTNFSTQFDESEPLSVFERWIVYLDYKVAKDDDRLAERQKSIGIEAINKLLPEGAAFSHVTSEGRIMFRIGGVEVPTISLSDGYRSILALVGDLVWRLMLAYPTSKDPLKEDGVVLIDELDIHLHPTWQWRVALLLRETFPNLQFIVSTHSPLIAAGAGHDALTLKFDFDGGKSKVTPVFGLANMNVDRMLQNPAFGLVSSFAPQTQRMIDRFDTLNRKSQRTSSEQLEFKSLLEFMDDARPFGGPPSPGSLDFKIDNYLNSHLK